MTGVYSSFQQAWQEHVPLDVHRVETDSPHACLEVEITEAEDRLGVRVVRDRRLEVARETWTLEEGAVRLGAASLFASVERREDGLEATISGGPLANPAPYRLLRARPFRGWIEVPEAGPYDPEVGSDTVYRRASGLRLHDQGGLAEITDHGGQPLTVELVQLVYGKALAILKLAVYAMPAPAVTYDSHAVAYTWTDPSAPRLGINLRDVVTGWTLDAEGMANSDDAGVPRSSAS